MRLLDRRFGLAALRFAGVLSLCLLPWPGLGTTFTRSFAAVGNVLVEGIRLDSRIAFRFEPVEGESPKAAWHVTMAIRDIRSGATTRPGLGLRLLAYVPFAVLFAFMAAVPATDRRAWPLSFALGVTLVGVFVTLSIGLVVVSILADARVRAIHLAPAMQSLTWAAASATVEASYVAPALLWLSARWLASGWVTSARVTSEPAR